jgi:hypothetical protein
LKDLQKKKKLDDLLAEAMRLQKNAKEKELKQKESKQGNIKKKKATTGKICC